MIAHDAPLGCRGRSVPAVVALLAFAAGCSDGPTTPDDTAGGVDLNVLFAPATQAEIDEVAADWASRSPAAEDVVVERDTVFMVDSVDVRVRVVSHLVDGLRHVGAIIAADGVTAPAPVIMYTHGGNDGVRIEDVLLLFPAIGDDADRFVWVIPSFRSEQLRFAGETFTSQGTPSPWDRDVDDALALLQVALAEEPAADETAVGVLGFSRGAGVALLMGARDPGIDRIVEFFGPTDFFDDYVREITADALNGGSSELPGFEYMNETFLQPLRRGEKTIAEVRIELVRRSPVLFVEDLPTLQLHHGTADDVVRVSQAQSLIDAMAAIGRGAPDFEAWLYEGGTHNPFSLIGSVGRTTDFLLALLPAPLARR